jgi:4-amino-4-deoxy-L-arabinose transferase-like glycosyltransferase
MWAREPGVRASTESWRWTAACAIGLVLLTVATRLPLLRLERPIDDEKVYAVVAQAIVDGGEPYVSAVERKPPGLFYVYATVLKGFGPFNWRALHAVETGWVLLTMAGLYVIGRRLFDPAAGLTAALFYSVFQAWSYWNNLAFNGEVLMNLPIVWAYAIGFSPRRRAGVDLLGAGGLLAAGFLLKQPAAIAAVPLGVYLLLPVYRTPRGYSVTDSLGQATWLTIGFAGVIAAVSAWLLARGLFQEAFYWTIGNHDVPHIYWGNAFWDTLAFVSFCLPITAGAWFSCRNREIWLDREAERDALVGLTVASAVGAAASARFFPHYYIALVPPCSLLSAPLFARMWRTASPRRLARPTQAWIAATVVAFTTVQARALSRQPAETETGRYLRAHSLVTDRIFVWGQAAGIYLDAQRRPASRYIATFPLTGLVFGAPPCAPRGCGIDTGKRIVPGAWDKLRQDFTSHEPEFIVDTEVGRDAAFPASQFPALANVLATEYQPVARTAEAQIYKRRHDTAR